jgi:hypothetical protein
LEKKKDQSKLQWGDWSEILRPIAFICVGRSKTGDTKNNGSMVHRQTIVDLYKREGQKMEKMAKNLKVIVLSTICEKREILEGMSV